MNRHLARAQEDFRRITAERLALNNAPCRECGTPLWNHVTRIAGHGFASPEPPRDAAQEGSE